MIGPKHLAVLHQIVSRLNAADLNWAVTASLSLALQGVPVDVHDIDLETDENGAYAVERIFSEFVTQAVRFCTAERIRSHFGALMIDGIKVDIMGGVQHRRTDGTWEDPTDWQSHRRLIEIDGMLVPVLSLEYEYEAYQKLGRTSKVELLGQWLHAQNGSA